MDEANQQTTGHTIWKNDKARFSEGVLSLYRTKPLGWMRYFNIAEGILQLENFNTNVRTAEEYGTPDEVIKGAQVILGLCMECAGVNPQSRSKPAAFCSQKCRVANHSRGKWKAFLSYLSKEGLSEVNVPEVSQELIRTLAGKLLTDIAQGINWKTVHDSKQRPGFDDLDDWTQFRVSTKKNRVGHWQNTFDAELMVQKTAIPVYDVNSNALRDPKIQELEDDLAAMWSDVEHRGAYFGKAGARIREKIRAIDPNHPLVKYRFSEDNTRPKYFTGPTPFPVKWTCNAPGVLQINDAEATFGKLLEEAKFRREREDQRQMAHDFPVIETEPGSREEVMALMEADINDLSQVQKYIKMEPGWKSEDPTEPRE